MKKYMMVLAALMVSAAPAYVAFQAQAEEAAATTEAPAAEVEVKEVTLEDGTKVHIKGEEVFVVGADGAETPAPDGEHKLSDGTTVKTAGGKLVTEEVAPEAPAQ